jgi:hypothetical protein
MLIGVGELMRDPDMICSRELMDRCHGLCSARFFSTTSLLVAAAGEDPKQTKTLLLVASSHRKFPSTDQPAMGRSRAWCGMRWSRRRSRVGYAGSRKRKQCWVDEEEAEWGVEMQGDVAATHLLWCPRNGDKTKKLY